MLLSRGGRVALQLALGAGAGALVGLLIWRFAEKQLEQSFTTGSREIARQAGMGEDQLALRLEQGRQQLRQQIASEVPPVVRATIDRQLASYGITPELGRRMSAVLLYAERQGWV